MENQDHRKDQLHFHLLVTKITIVSGLFVLMLFTRYFEFMRTRPSLFLLEISVFTAGTLTMVLIMYWFRGLLATSKIRTHSLPKMAKTMVILSLLTIAIVIIAEGAGFEACLVEHPDPSVSKIQSEIIGKIIWSMLVVLGLTLIAAIVYFSSSNINSDPHHVALLQIYESMGGATPIMIACILSIVCGTIIAVKHSTTLVGSQWNSTARRIVVGIATAYGTLFCLYVIWMLWFGFTRVHSFAIYSYLADTAWHGTSLLRASIGIFIIESLLVAGCTAVPILLVARDRNPEHYKLKTDTAALLEFGMLTIKIALLYVMFQMAGQMDGLNLVNDSSSTTYYYRTKCNTPSYQGPGSAKLYDNDCNKMTPAFYP